MKETAGPVSRVFKLVADRTASIARVFSRLLGDEDGSWLIVMTVAFPVLIGMAGIGTEGTMLFYEHRSLQSAADAAAFSAAQAYSYDNSISSTALTAQAQAVVAGYGFTLGSGTNQANVAATSTTFATFAAVQVTISRPQTAIFSSIYLPTLSNAVTATAVIDAANSGSCILAFGNTSTGNNASSAINLGGNATLNANGCGVYSNSSDCMKGSYSFYLQGNPTINAGSVGSAGCLSMGGSALVNLDSGASCTAGSQSPCTQGNGTISDPYAGVFTFASGGTFPPASCAAQPSAVGGTVTLAPGRYCGIDATSANVSLTGGVYILDCSKSTCPNLQGTRTMLAVKGNSLTTASGAGATLVFTCSTCAQASDWPSNGVFVASNGSISITAPCSGTSSTITTPTTPCSASTAGFVVIGDPAMPYGTVFDTHSNPNTCFNGTVYAPSGAFNMNGTPTTGCTNTFCQQFLVNTIYFSGNTVDNFNTTSCALTGKQKPVGNIVTLVD